VRADVALAGGADGGVPASAPPVAEPERRFQRRGDQEIVRQFSLAPARERFDEDGRQRNGALLVGLGRTKEQLPTDLGRRLRDSQA
jgi:hypothetical protein